MKEKDGSRQQLASETRNAAGIGRLTFYGLVCRDGDIGIRKSSAVIDSNGPSLVVEALERIHSTNNYSIRPKKIVL